MFEQGDAFSSRGYTRALPGHQTLQQSFKCNQCISALRSTIALTRNKPWCTEHIVPLKARSTVYSYLHYALGSTHIERGLNITHYCLLFAHDWPAQIISRYMPLDAVEEHRKHNVVNFAGRSEWLSFKTSSWTIPNFRPFWKTWKKLVFLRHMC